MTSERLKRVCQDAAMPIRSLSSSKTPRFVLEEHQAWCDRAKKLFSLGLYSEALDICDRALALQYDDCETWILRGCVLTHLDRYKEALASFEKALEIQPHDQLALIFRGMALHHLNRYQQAYASYDQALGRQRLKKRSLLAKLIRFFKR
ncbi:MAG TPA: tetratricopeptide repeat protein [Coleofasciculaceae cyanobacterium]